MINLIDLFPKVSSNDLLDLNDCNITRYGICKDPECSEIFDQYPDIDESFIIDGDNLTFPTNLNHPPVNAFIGALSPNRRVWSVLPVKFEVCGYEKIKAKADAMIKLGETIAASGVTTHKIDLSKLFENDSPNNFCKIVEYSVRAKGEKGSLLGAGFANFLTIKDSELTVKVEETVFDFSIMASTLNKVTAFKQFSIDFSFLKENECPIFAEDPADWDVAVQSILPEDSVDPEFTSP